MRPFMFLLNTHRPFVHIGLVCNPSPYSSRLHSALALLSTAPYAAHAGKRTSLAVLRPNIADSQSLYGAAGAPRAFWSTLQMHRLCVCRDLTGTAFRLDALSQQTILGRAFSFSPDGLSDEMDADCPALCPHQWSGPQDVRPATAADSTSPGTTAKANPELSLPSGEDHGSRSRPYPVRAYVGDLRFGATQHCLLALGLQ